MRAAFLIMNLLNSQYDAVDAVTSVMVRVQVSYDLFQKIRSLAELADAGG